MIPLSKELEHVKRYVSLEKLRFHERVNVEYSIEAEEFLLPTLCIQILVENAIKHGISKKPEGGTVKVTIEDLKNGYRICVMDDGVGFVYQKRTEEDRSHVGLENLKRRVEVLCKGKMEVDSCPGTGTAITIYLPKGKDEDGNSGT